MENKIEVKRIALKDTYTIGKLYYNGTYVCDTLEDKVRSFTAADPKVFGQTAIPYGTYTVTKETNAHFGNHFRIHNVPYFDGTLIHCGNTDIDTHGCILVGINSVKGQVLNSKVSLTKLYSLITNVTGLTIVISN